MKAAILDTANTYDTVCVGLSEQSKASRLMFGTIAECISREATSNVDIVRGTYDKAAAMEPRTRAARTRIK